MVWKVYRWRLSLLEVWAGGGMKNCLLPLLFLRSLIILLGCSIINTCVCLQDMNLLWIAPMPYHAHTGFPYSKLLNSLPYDCGNFSSISGVGWVGVLLGASGTSRCCATCIQYPLASQSFSRRIRKSWNSSSQCGIIPLCQVLQNFTSVLVAVFIIEYSSVIRNITFRSLCIILQPHCWTACSQECNVPCC
jgi:hypothetical protein